MLKHTHIGAYGIALKNEQILLVKKQRGPYTKKWDLPGGGIEEGENSIEALIREFSEETGYKVLKSELADVLNNRIEYVNDNNQLEEVTLISIVYLVDIENDETKEFITTEDVSEFRWFDICEAENLKLTPIAEFFKKRKLKRCNS